LTTKVMSCDLLWDITQHRVLIRGTSKFVILEDGTNILTRNVGKVFITLRCVISQKSAYLIYIAAEAWNHATHILCGLSITTWWSSQHIYCTRYTSHCYL